jgi:ABC-2 type transport system ATP-binding protein
VSPLPQHRSGPLEAGAAEGLKVSLIDHPRASGALSDPAIRVRGVTKTFKPRARTPIEWLLRKPKKPPVEALRGVDLTIERGELFGLLGPNGAGKTTLVKILSTLLLPTDGEAIVAGHDVRADANAIRRKVGVVLGGDRALYWRLTARENLWYFSQLYDMPKEEARAAVERVLGEVNLLDRADDRVETYSKGMKQRLHIARGLLTDPDILLLDEPTIGLDPHAARSLRALVRKLVDEQKRTVVLTTHYLYEADELCDRAAIIHRGLIVSQDTPAALKAAHAGGTALVVRVRKAPRELGERLVAAPGVRALASQREEPAEGVTEYRLTGPDVENAAAQVAAQVHASGGGLVGIRVEKPTLEDVFVALTGEGISGQGEAA